MKLVTFHSTHALHVGALAGERIVDLSAAGIAATMGELIHLGADGLKAASQAVADSSAPSVYLRDARLAPPIVPGKILCSGINYKGHAEENPNAKMPTEPFFFAKLPSSLAGPHDEIRCPPMTKQLDYEVEFCAVIGRRLSRAAEADVMPALFGYTLLNDVSARDVQMKDAQITLGKNFDRFAPIGPCIVTADEMARPGEVRLKTRLNGKIMQDGTTADWLFPLPRLIAFLSQVMTLEPGDVVSTGTPAGVGLFRNPQVFMQPGDVIEIEAEGIGVLRNTITA
jgi:2-keto-4-pentenoate hydratase/2-oxohepta-3-ene-1,7-dioic acid hydratase in catechol pathway